MVPWTMAPSDGQHGAGSGGPGHAQKSKGASSSHALSASAQSDPGPSNPYWSEAWSSPYTTEWPTGPICVNGKQLIAYNSSEKRSVTYGAFDFGGEHTFEVQHVKAPWPSTPRGDLIISWFSCEGNLNHLVREMPRPPLTPTLSAAPPPGPHGKRPAARPGSARAQPRRAPTPARTLPLTLTRWARRSSPRGSSCRSTGPPRRRTSSSWGPGGRQLRSGAHAGLLGAPRDR